MSKITNDGLTLSGTGCFIAVPTWQQWASGRDTAKVNGCRLVASDFHLRRLATGVRTTLQQVDEATDGTLTSCGARPAAVLAFLRSDEVLDARL